MQYVPGGKGKRSKALVLEQSTFKIFTKCTNTVVSAYIPPGYKAISASVPLKEFPDCFCYPLHSEVSLFSLTGYKHKPASVL